MKKLAIGMLVLIAIGALGIELIAPQLAAASIEEHIREQTAGVAGVSADVGRFPVVTRLLATQHVQRVGVTLNEVASQQLTFTAVRFELRGVRLDRDALRSGDVRVRGMQGGQVTALLDADALSAALGVPVQVEDGRVVATVGGTDVEIPLALDGTALAMPAGLSPVALPDLVPCRNVEPVVADGHVEVSCALDEVPAFLT